MAWNIKFLQQPLQQPSGFIKKVSQILSRFTWPHHDLPTGVNAYGYVSWPRFIWPHPTPLLLGVGFVICLLTISPLKATGGSLTAAQRAELVRDLTAEYGTAKIQLPRSKKPLPIMPNGQYDPTQWSEAMQKFGPAARIGDLVQITSIQFEGKKLVMVINYGLSGGRKWWHRIQISGTSNRGTTLGANQNTHAPGGTTLALVFPKAIPYKSAADFKAMLKPVLDFEQRTATELFLDTIEPKYREAIENNVVVEGMDKEMVLLSKNRPSKKMRDFKDGIETEDWIYGEPPGNIIFITFLDGVVVQVKTSRAAIGGWVKEIPPIER